MLTFNISLISNESASPATTYGFLSILKLNLTTTGVDQADGVFDEMRMRQWHPPLVGHIFANVLCRIAKVETNRGNNKKFDSSDNDIAATRKFRSLSPIDGLIHSQVISIDPTSCMDQMSSKAIAEALLEWASSPIAVSDPILPVGSPPAVALAVLACYSHRIHSQEGKITVCVHVCCVLVLSISYRLFASASCVGCATGHIACPSGS